MQSNLYYNTTTPLLQASLRELMREKIFDPFRLVGGTSLSLQLGHRMSDDIDLFTDAPYDSIDFAEIDDYLNRKFNYVSSSDYKIIGVGKAYFVGGNKNACIKLDVFYADTFIREPILIDGIRLASLEEIVAMKLEVISHGGRKKDFWDVHELMNTFSLPQMLAVHKERYPRSHNKRKLLSKFGDFRNADEDFDPVCLSGKHWEVIKMDFVDALSQ